MQLQNEKRESEDKVRKILLSCVADLDPSIVEPTPCEVCEGKAGPSERGEDAGTLKHLVATLPIVHMSHDHLFR